MNVLSSQQRFLHCGGQRIAVYEAGPKSALSLLLCHGNSSSAKTFIRQFEGLSTHFHLVALDLPGHGDSDDASSSEIYSLPGYADVIRAVANECCPAALLVVGLSLGGHVMLEALADLPQVIAAVLVGTPPITSISDFGAAFNPIPALTVLQKGDVSTDEIYEFANACVSPGTTGLPAWLMTDFQRADPEARVALIRSVAENRFMDEKRIVREAIVPIVQVFGEQDRLISKSYFTQNLLDCFWRGQLQLIPQAGHMPQWENASAFHDLLNLVIRES